MDNLVKYSILLILIAQSFCSLTEAYSYKITDGYQIYYIKNNQYFLYATLTGSSANIQIIMNLLVTDPNTSAITNGLWAGIGFGSKEMDKSDMVVFTYNKQTFGCADYWAPAMMIQTDVLLGGNNDVTYVSGNVESLDATYSPYTKLYTWTCTKKLSTLDAYDWADFPNWLTNEGPTIGAVGGLSSNGQISQHNYNSDILKLVDGENDPSSSGFLKFGLAAMMLLVLLF